MFYSREQLRERVNAAVTKYVTMRGMKILAHGYEDAEHQIDLICQDEDDVIRFITIRACKHHLPDKLNIERYRRNMEDGASNWLAIHREIPGYLRLEFDVIDVGVVGENFNRAIIRHQSNVLANPDIKEKHTIDESRDLPLQKPSIDMEVETAD